LPATVRVTILVATVARVVTESVSPLVPVAVMTTL